MKEKAKLLKKNVRTKAVKKENEENNNNNTKKLMNLHLPPESMRERGWSETRANREKSRADDLI